MLAGTMLVGGLGVLKYSQHRLKHCCLWMLFWYALRTDIVIFSLSAYGQLLSQLSPVSVRGWRNTVGNLIETSWLKQNNHWPHVTSTCVNKRGARFHRTRDFKQCQLNSIPPTSQVRPGFPVFHLLLILLLLLLLRLLLLWLLWLWVPTCQTEAHGMITMYYRNNDNNNNEHNTTKHATNANNKHTN